MIRCLTEVATAWLLACLLAGGTSAQGQASGVYLPHLVGEDLLVALGEQFFPYELLGPEQRDDTLFSVVDRVVVAGEAGALGVYTALFVPFDCLPSCDPSDDVYNGGEGLRPEFAWPLGRGLGGSYAERDMHNAFPARVAVASARATQPYGEIPDPATTAWYYLDLVVNTVPPEPERALYSERWATVRFEPREDAKGDVARAIFYVAAIHDPQGAPGFFEEMLPTLLAWNEGDPPDDAERARTARIAGYQRSDVGEPLPNPFVLDVTLARRAFASETLVQPVLFVDRSATGLAWGSTWADAFTDLSTAFAVAAAHPGAVAEVRVAEGTYRPPALSSSPRNASFRPPSGVTVLGGYPARGGERDPAAHPTVLSGDLGVAGFPADNAHHVVRVEGATGVVLDGLTITGGNAEDYPRAVGSALYARDAELTVRWCRVTANRTLESAAVAVLDDVVALFEDVTVAGNTSVGGAAGIFVGAGNASVPNPVQPEVVFRRITVSGNTGSTGGMSVYYGRVQIVDAAFLRNFGSAHGALSISFSDVAIYGALFLGNQGGRGFQQRVHIGGAISASNPPVPVVVANAAFVANFASYGSALAAHGGTIELTNATFVANGAHAAPGSLIHLYDLGGRVHLRNAVVVGNGRATVNGPGYDIGPGALVGTFKATNPELLLSSVLLDEPCAPAPAVCEGTVEGDPTFVVPPATGADGVWGTVDDEYGDLRLREGSPALDSGLAAFLPPDAADLDGDGDVAEPLPFDLAGLPRVQGPSVDLGPHEGSVVVAAGPWPIRIEDDLTTARPNPARTSATLHLTLASPHARVRVEAFDALGRMVATMHDGPLGRGVHVLALHASRLPPGVYVVRATADGLALSRTVTVAR